MSRRAMGLPLVAAGSWATAAAAILVPEAAPPACVVLWAAVAAVVLWTARRPRRVTVLLALALAAAAGVATTVALAEPARSAAAELVAGGGEVGAMVTVTGRAERAATGEFWFDATASRLEARGEVADDPVPIRAALPAGDRAPRVGEMLRIRGDAWRPDPGERAAVIVRASRSAQAAPASGLWAALAGLRDGLARAAGTLPGPGAALIPGLAVGDTAAVSVPLEDAMRGSSLTHLTAVSGANCAIVVGMAFGIAAGCGAPRGVRVGAGLGTLMLFVLLVTPEPSVVRAAAMAAIAMVAVGLGRSAAGLAALSVAVAILLVTDPWLALSMGFALSATATAALLVLARPLAVALGRFLPQPLALAIAVPLSAQLACGPLLVLLDPAVPLLGVVANLLAAPAAPLATIAGFFACLAAPLPALQGLLVGMAWVPSSWIAAVAETVAGVPGQRIPWPAGPAGALALAACTGALVVALTGPRARGWLRLLAAGVVAVAGGIAAGQSALTGVAASWTTPAAWQIAVCDVGQGDAVLVRSGTAVGLIDTGPDPASLRTCLERFGVQRLDLVVLTHFDADHAGGAAALAGRARLVVHGPPDADGARALAALHRSGAEIRRVAAGDEGSLGAAQWHVLWPSASTQVPGNDASVVIQMVGGGLPRLLLLGDLSAEPQARIRTAAAGWGAAVVKVAHHGSADQDPRLYTELAAELALIPVGADNDYGHPRPTLLQTLRAAGSVIARTDQDGAIAVWQDGATLRLWREHGVAPAD